VRPGSVLLFAVVPIGAKIMRVAIGSRVCPKGRSAGPPLTRWPRAGHWGAEEDGLGGAACVLSERGVSGGLGVGPGARPGLPRQRPECPAPGAAQRRRLTKQPGRILGRVEGQDLVVTVQRLK